MPELPEVETIKRGIAPHIEKHVVQKVIIREKRLRWLIPDNLATLMKKKCLEKVHRRGKYLLFQFSQGYLLIHLGMSGSLRLLPTSSPSQKHDHVDIIFNEDVCLRYRDPRRFGCILWTDLPVIEHPLLKNLGPEPLERKFNGQYLYNLTRVKRVAIKSCIMNSHHVVGVGNIYANEALFLAKLSPFLPVNQLTLLQCKQLVKQIKHVLNLAVKKGGTTLRDFVNEQGQPGYFQQVLQVYGRQGQPCENCRNKIIKTQQQGQRATYYCPCCQTS